MKLKNCEEIVGTLVELEEHNDASYFIFNASLLIHVI